MYIPSQKTLNNYAHVLVDFALNGGQGIKPGEVVVLQCPESAKPLLKELYQVVLQAKAHAIIQYLPDDMERMFYDNAIDDQLNFFPAKLLKGRVRQADHFISILAETNLHELEGIDPQKIMQKSSAFKPYLDWRNRKENRGKLTWTLGLYPTKAMADEAGLSLHECWNQVIKACYLNHSDPIKKWQTIQKNINRIKRKLNSLPIVSLNIKSTNTDLTIGIDKNRNWLGGDGRNIPSFEIFISPDWRKTEGNISFDMPLYRYGNEIRDIYLEFKAGVVVKSSASKGELVLKKMIATKDANKVGEFSLTDIRMSKITKLMAETLYDENFGGTHGNTHIALGMAYKESYPHNLKKVTKKDWEDMGYNDSVVHTDIISTANRVITATLSDGSIRIIYRDGKFTF